MSISLFIESETDSGKLQTMLVPTESDVLMFHRLSNGQRGRGSAWQPTTNLDELPDSPVTAIPVGVILTERDVANASIGNITSLSVKALAIPAVSVSVSPFKNQPHRQVVSTLRDQLFSGDSTLNQFVNDGRRSNPVILKPIKTLEMAFHSAIAPTAEPSIISDKPTNVVPLPVTPAMHTELAKVPDRKWADEYLNRKATKDKTDFDILDVAMKFGQNVLIRGHAGSGKTMCVLAWASARGYRYYNISANVGLEPSHLFGAWTPTEQAGVFRWQDGPVTDLVRHGGVLLLNEIDFMPERITTVLFGLLDDRREIQLLENGGEVIKAHPDLVVIGDHNPNYRGSRPMNQAWKDRFAHKLEFDYDKVIERKLIKNDALLEVASKLRAQTDKGEIDTPVSTRGLISFVKNTQNIGLDYAINSYLNGFLDDERDAVKLVFETAKSNIAKDFGLKVEVTTAQSDE